jgi:hypothetical protein
MKGDRAVAYAFDEYVTPLPGLDPSELQERVDARLIQ